MSKEAWTVVADAVASVVIVAVGVWVAPEYRDFALATVAALQAVAGALIVEFRSARKVDALQTEIKALRRQR